MPEPCPVDDRETQASFLAPIADVRSHGDGGFMGVSGHRADAPAAMTIRVDAARSAAQSGSSWVQLMRF